MKKLFTFLSFCCAYQINAQPMQMPAGGGTYHPEPTICVTATEYDRINLMLQENIKQLKAEGKLPSDWGAQTAQRPSNSNFIWPVQQQSGFSYNSVYGISNFVDLNPMYPDQLLDWNCGTRTYDLSGGYNHGGIDIFLWPFGQRMQEDNQVAIISAADGVIIGKDDGQFDKNCAMSNLQWNAVYVGNADGTICWYGHMKKNSLTNKAVGQQVSQGEFLGIVGSSGSSTGPHLHFEVHDASSNVIEPYSGNCNNITSLWQNQKPYYEPTINALLTHSSPPVFPNCPQLEITNVKQYFYTGDSIYFASYLHDQDDAQIKYEIIQPSQIVYNTWNHQLPAGQYYTASYWYWTGFVTEGFPSGEWQFKATYKGNVVTIPFYVNVTNSITDPAFSKVAHIYPNPATNSFTIEGLEQNSGNVQVSIHAITGTIVHNSIYSSKEGRISLNLTLASGNYMVKITNANGKRQQAKLVITQD